MSLKHELDKIVELERSKLEKEDNQRELLKDSEIRYFSTLANMLRELEKELDEKYFSFEIGERGATINIMVSRDVIWDVGYWVISCRLDSDENAVMTHKTGFWLDKRHWRTRKSIGDYLEFSNESELLEYMLNELSKRIAYYQNMDNKYGKEWVKGWGERVKEERRSFGHFNDLD